MSRPHRLRWLISALPALLIAVLVALLALFRQEPTEDNAPDTTATTETAAGTASSGQTSELAAETLPPELAASAQREIERRTIARGLEAAGAASAHPAFDEFRDWVNRWREADADSRPDLIEEGETLARQRQPRMIELIRTDPEAALAQALSWSDWASLPAPLRPLVEEPFTSRPDLDVFPLCHDDSENGKRHVAEVLLSGRDRVMELDFGDGRRSETFVYGWRTESLSREGIPVQGIRLNELAAMREPVFQRLSRPDDIAYVREHFPVANPDPARDFSDGSPLPDQPVVALSGGRVFLFSDHESLESFEGEIAPLEKTIGPKAGSRLVHETLAAMDGEEGFDVDGLEIAFSQWTESHHNAYVILVDFPNRTGAPIAPSTFQNRMDGPVHDLLAEMSFGKTGMTTTVDPTIYRMPQPTSYYDGSDGSGNKKNGDLHNHAIAAAVAAGKNPNSYNHRIVIFKGPSMGYCGLATVGGGKIWLPCTSVKVTIHELGHNYGLSHASYWSGTGNDPVAPGGSSSEYGDNTDMMGGGNDPSGHFHVQGKRKLNWIEGNQTHFVHGGNSGDTVRLYRFDHSGLDPANLTRAIRATKGNNEYYWIGYRQRYTANQFEHYEKGVQILWQQPNKSKSWLIDTTPGSSGGKNDAGTALARTYSDPNANIHVTPVDRGGAGANAWIDVVVKLGPFPGNRAPNVSISAPDPVPPGQTARLQVVGTDPDGDSLAYAWDFGDGIVHPNRSWFDISWANEGTYPVTCHVTDMKGQVTTARLDVHVSAILPPTSLSATDGTWEDRVSLRWTGVPAGSPTYRVLRSAVDETLAEAGEIGTTTATTFDDLTAAPGVPYRYWIQAAYSGGATATSGSDTGYRYISSPAPLTATGTTSGIQLAWQNVAGTDNFRVYRSLFPNGGSPVLVATVPGDTTHHLDDTVPTGSRYYYYVEAFANGITGDPSNIARARRVIEAPVNFTVSRDSFNFVRLDWSARQGSNSYLVYRGRTDRFEDAVYLGTTREIFFVDRHAVPGIAYRYWVRGFSAVNGFSEVAVSTVEGRRLGGPSRPVVEPGDPPSGDDTSPVDTLDAIRQRFEGFVLAPDDTDDTSILGSFSANLGTQALSVGLRFDGSRWAGRGSLDGEGKTTLELRAFGRDPLPATFQLTRTQAGATRLEGTLGPDAAPLGMVDAGCLDLHPVTNPASFAGNYTLALPHDPAADATESPAGDSVGTGFIHASGRYWFRLHLADGALCTLGGTASGEGELFCFGAPYPGREPGLLAGKLVARALANVSDLDGQWRWTRPADLPRPELYPAGFDVTRAAVASLYEAPARGERVLGMLADGEANALWSLRDGNLNPVPSSRHVTWDDRNRVTGADLPEDEFLQVRVSPRDGLVSGLYRKQVNDGFQLVRFFGVALQRQGLVTGHFPGRAQSGWFVLEPTGLPSLTVRDLSSNEVSPGGLLDFGDVGIDGGIGERLLEIVNLGDGNLRLPRLPEIGGEGFSLAAARPGDLGPGESMLLRLSFDPASEGAAVGQLAIRSNDAGANPFLLNLTGNGIPGSGSSLETGAPLSPIAIGDGWMPVDLEPVAFDPALHESRYGEATATDDADGFGSALSVSGWLRRGVLSLRIVLDGEVGVLSGQVEADGTVTTSRWTGKLSRTWDLTGLQLAEPVGGGAPALIGALAPIDSEGGLSPIPLRLAQLPWHFRNRSPVTGPFTLILPAEEDLGSGLPNGDGVAVGSVNPGGVLRARIFLPDGQRQSLAAPLDADATAHFVRTWPLGRLEGSLRFRELLGISDADGNLAWERPPHTRGGAFARGFYLERPLLASAWHRPDRGETALKGLAAGPDNASLVVTGLPAPFPAPIAHTWLSNHRILVPTPPSGDSWRLTVSPQNGLVTGYLRRDGDPGFASFRGFGVVFDAQNLVTGYLLDRDGNCAHLLVEPSATGN